MKQRKIPQPPKFSRFILRHLSMYEANHSVLGDFEESFHKIANKRSPLHARLWFCTQVYCSLLAYSKLLITTGIGLLFNYLKVTFRNLNRHRIYTAINISGLSLGLAAVILIFLHMHFETSYDRYHDSADHIYRIVDQEYTAIPFILGDILHDRSPEIEDMVRLKEITVWGSLLLEIEGKQVLED